MGTEMEGRRGVFLFLLQSHSLSLSLNILSLPCLFFSLGERTNSGERTDWTNERRNRRKVESIKEIGCCRNVRARVGQRSRTRRSLS